MSRAAKVIQVEGRCEVTVKEISPYGVWQAYQKGSSGYEEMIALFNDAISPGFEEIRTWYPSEINIVVEKFMEVNDGFFSIARKLKVDGLLAEIVKDMSKSLPPLFIDSYKVVMAKKLGAMDGATS